jgi:hypothetical protein
VAILTRQRTPNGKITDFAPGDTNWHVVTLPNGHNWPGIDDNLGGAPYDRAVIRAEAAGGAADSAGGFQWLPNTTSPSGTGFRVSSGGQAETLPNGLRCIAVKADSATDHIVIETEW